MKFDIKFFCRLDERSQRAESSINKRWQRTNSKVGEEADKEPPLGTLKWALNDEWRAHLKQVEEEEAAQRYIKYLMYLTIEKGVNIKKILKRNLFMCIFP